MNNVNPQEQPDIYLPYAKTQLADAIHELVGTRTTRIYSDNNTARTFVRPSRYTELTNELAGHQGNQNGGINRSMPPLWVDAADWLTKVDNTVRNWCTDPYTNTTTPDRLYALEDTPWRPQDVPRMQHITEAVLRFTAQADHLLEPERHRKWELTAPCPSCNTRTVYRPDSAGEYVRQAALTVTEHGCHCLACNTHWTPDYFHHLARVLNCPLPAGVLE